MRASLFRTERSLSAPRNGNEEAGMLMESPGPVNLKSHSPSHWLEETVNKEAGNQECPCSPLVSQAIADARLSTQTIRNKGFKCCSRSVSHDPVRHGTSMALPPSVGGRYRGGRREAVRFLCPCLCRLQLLRARPLILRVVEGGSRCTDSFSDHCGPVGGGCARGLRPGL